MPTRAASKRARWLVERCSWHRSADDAVPWPCHCWLRRPRCWSPSPRPEPGGWIPASPGRSRPSGARGVRRRRSVPCWPIVLLLKTLKRTHQMHAHWSAQDEFDGSSVCPLSKFETELHERTVRIRIEPKVRRPSEKQQLFRHFTLPVSKRFAPASQGSNPSARRMTHVLPRSRDYEC